MTVLALLAGQRSGDHDLGCQKLAEPPLTNSTQRSNLKQYPVQYPMVSSQYPAQYPAETPQAVPRSVPKDLLKQYHARYPALLYQQSPLTQPQVQYPALPYLA